VSEEIIDTVSRRAADTVSRRASLLALGGMALAALTAVPAAAKGGKGGKKRKKRKGGDGGRSNAGEQLAQARCASQVDQCRTSVSGFCDPEDCPAQLSCCDMFATCNAVGALACIFPGN
jgi:hypothetical protein